MKTALALLAAAVALLFLDSVGSRHPCAGCDVLSFDPLELLIVALATLAIARVVYLFVRRRSSTRDATRRIVLMALGAIAIAIGAIGVVRLAHSTDERAIVTVGQKGMERSDPFALQGDYRATWSATAGAGASCRLEANLESAGGATFSQKLASVSLVAAATQSGSVSFGGLEAADYAVVAAAADCDWSVTFTPQ